jgi:ferric-dicitrate binding protein FerR (iron transport regulator)
MEIEGLYLRFIQDRCTPQEQKMLLDKMESDPAFKHEMVVLKNLYVSSLANDGEASHEEMARFKERIDGSERERKHINEHRPDYWRAGGRIGFGKAAVWSMAAAILLFLILNLNFNWVAKKPPVVPIESLASGDVNSLYTSKGVKGKVVLPDSSIVTLNSDSRITYPNRFSGSSREVNFTGEAYFQVRKDSLMPMIIHCDRNFDIKVYGTTFNVKSYKDDRDAVTTLVEGNVKVVQNVDGKEVVTNINPNESCVIDKNGVATVEVYKDPKDKYAWKDGKLVFKSTRLEDAIVILERWHGVDFEILDPAKKDMSITATFTTESVFQIMDLLHFSMGIDYTISDNKVTIK